MDFESVKKMMLRKLKVELPAFLTYHNLSHVLDVLESAENIGRSEGVSGEDMILLKTAALFHDSGFIKGPQNHEEASCEIAQKILPDFGYTQHQVDIVNGIILATKIPQMPHNHLEDIIGDADLDYLGRDDFFSIGNGLFEELKYFGVLRTETEWNELQRNFIEAHSYHSKTSLANRELKKQKHLKAIKAKLLKSKK
jgi:uncharacterized protein